MAVSKTVVPNGTVGSNPTLSAILSKIFLFKLYRKIQMNKKIYRKNEIRAKCEHCGSERVFAYWDEELEYFIYLSDEPVTCLSCNSNHNTNNNTQNAAERNIYSISSLH